MTKNFATDDKIYINVAFAVTPYLLYTVLKAENKEYVDMAVRRGIGTVFILPTFTISNRMVQQ